MITGIIETETITIVKNIGYTCSTLDEAKEVYKCLKSKGYAVKAYITHDCFGNINYQIML